MTSPTSGIAVHRLGRLSSPTVRLWSLARTHRSHVQLAVTTAFYFAFACYLTRPMVTNIGHSFYGGPGDQTGGMAFLRELVDHHHNPFLPGKISQLAAPEGQLIPWTRDLASAPGILTLYLLTALFGVIKAFNLYVLAGYTLTGAATFLLARRLTANTWVSLIAGWTFAFYPYAAMNGESHLDNIQGWVLVIALWRLIELAWHPTRRNGLLAGIAIVLSMWWSPYFILLMGVTYIAVSTVLVLIAARRHTFRVVVRAHLPAALIVLLFAAFLGALSTVGITESVGVRDNSMREIINWSARWFEYLIPDDRSPLFGGLTHPLLDSLRHSAPTGENGLYMGITTVALAGVALVTLVRRRLSARPALATFVLCIVATSAIVMSMPPTIEIWGASLPTPSHLVTSVTTTWRVYARFVIVAMLASTLLAAIGLDVLTRHRRLHTRAAAMLLATIIVPLDLWWSPPHPSVSTVTTPQLYRTLASQPPGLVAEYPLTATDGTYHDEFFQNVYDKPMINGYLPGTAQALRAHLLGNLASPTTAPDLATLGVRYVLLDSGTYGSLWGPTGEPGLGFKLIASGPPGRLYVVTAKPTSPAVPTVGEGFNMVDIRDREMAGALEQPSGRIELAGTCDDCRGVLSMLLTPANRAQKVTISDSGGHVLSGGLLRQTSLVRIPLSFAKQTTLTITATPGPTPIGPELDFSIEVRHLEFSGARPKLGQSR